MMPRDTEREEQRPEVAENRAYPRVKVHSLAYIELGEGNAGLILNISETGMAIQAVQNVSSDYFPRMHFRLPKTDALVQASGKVIWQIKSKKEVGIEFAAISDQTRDVIRKWIADEENRQTESEEIHQRSLDDFAGTGPETTTFQKYPSESGDEDMEVPVTLAPPPEPPPIDPPVIPAQVRPANGIGPLGGISSASAARPAPLEFPAPPRRVPDRWRPEPNILGTHSAQGLSPSRPPERIFGNPPWNRQTTIPRFGIEPKRTRPRWPYALMVILLAVVAVAGITTVDPGLIDRARVEAWVGGVTASLKHSSSNGASQTQQANATSPRANAAPPSTATQAPSTGKPQGTAAAQVGTTPAQAGSTNAQSNAPSNAAPATTQTSQADNDASASPAQPSAPTADSSRSGGSQSNSAAGTATPEQPGGASQPQSQAQSPAASAHEEPTAQTTLPPPSNSAASSTARRQNRTLPRRSTQSQDAYASSAPYVASRSYGTPQSDATPPDAFVVEVSGFPSVPVPPSTPFEGVASGSVAANSQLHAIWVPTSLEWARQYLPSNLGVGRLLSSYSPAYPMDAARAGIQGTVRLDVTVATDGTVRTVSVLSGPPSLARVAVSAVRDWRYGTSFLAGQSIETEHYVSVVFRLTAAR